MSNWYALCIAILNDVSVDIALDKMGISIKKKRGMGSHVRQSNIDSIAIPILKMRQEGITWKNIGETFGYTESSVRGIVRRYKKKVTQAPTKVS